MAARYLLDTNICIYIRRQRPPAVLERFRRLKPGEAVISVITWGERANGVEKSRQRDKVLALLEELVTMLPVMPLPETAGQSYGAIRAALEAYHQRIPTAQLNDAMKAIQAQHPAPGARILYAVQGAVDPPTVTLFASRRLQSHYLRYVEKQLRERFALGPTPLKLRVRLRGKS